MNGFKQALKNLVISFPIVLIGVLFSIWLNLEFLKISFVSIWVIFIYYPMIKERVLEIRELS